MGVRVKTVKNDFYKMEKTIEELKSAKVNVGILGGGEQAWLAAIHEYGCKITVTPKMRAYLHKMGLHLKASTITITIPERSFLRSGFDENHKQVLKDNDAVINAMIGGKMTVNAGAGMIGQQLAKAIQNYARALSSPANHPFTVEQKGSSNPLIDSGDMIGAITFEVVRE